MRRQAAIISRMALAGVLVVLLGQASAPHAVYAQNPGIQIAGASPISPIILSRGCNQVIATSQSGTPVAALAGLVQPAGAVVSIWRFDNTTQTYRAGYFSGGGAPVDFTRTGTAAGNATEAYFVCLSQAATMLST